MLSRPIDRSFGCEWNASNGWYAARVRSCTGSTLQLCSRLSLTGRSEIRHELEHQTFLIAQRYPRPFEIAIQLLTRLAHGFCQRLLASKRLQSVSEHPTEFWIPHYFSSSMTSLQPHTKNKQSLLRNHNSTLLHVSQEHRYSRIFTTVLTKHTLQAFLREKIKTNFQHRGFLDEIHLYESGKLGMKETAASPSHLHTIPISDFFFLFLGFGWDALQEDCQPG